MADTNEATLVAPTEENLVTVIATSAPAVEDDILQPKISEQDAREAMANIIEATRIVDVEDINAAFVPEEGELWAIPTGRFDAQGRQLALRVKVKDPRRPELPTQYMAAVQKLGESRAALGLWQACVMEPVALKNPANFEKTTTSFRATLTARLLLLAGVNQDFLAATMASNSMAAPTGTKSSPTSPPPSAPPSTLPPPSPPQTSGVTTTKPSASVSATVPNL